MQEAYKKLTQLIKNHDNIFVMAHKNIDLDALGSIICLYKIIESFKKTPYLVMSSHEKNPSIVKAKKHLSKENITFNMVSNCDYDKFFKEESMVIVVDTHKKEMVECSGLLTEVKDIVVIDHHIMNGKYIDNTVFSFIDSTLSSMIEFMVGYLKYLNKEIDPVIATISLAGLEIDTNSFNTKTGIGTYVAASSLARMGANNKLKQELLQENKEMFKMRMKNILNSETVNSKYEICILDDNIYEQKDLAVIAEELLKFELVEATFAIGKTSENKVGISARSLGSVDVQSIIHNFGGGGHMTEAAVQIKDTEIMTIKKQLLDLI